uniref:Uncharacterized protein n=1 Tax=Octopus bimaculoides TaxID=37653 RepID=A0A0L8FGA2_OCTBM
MRKIEEISLLYITYSTPAVSIATGKIIFRISYGQILKKNHKISEKNLLIFKSYAKRNHEVDEKIVWFHMQKRDYGCNYRRNT